MKTIDASYVIRTHISPDGLEELLNLEDAGRTCYKSQATSPEATKRFIDRILESGHESVLEHGIISVRFICDRGISHELVRHRLCAFTQESTRYCNYSQDKFGNELTFIRPCYLHLDENGDAYGDYFWTKAMMQAEESYFEMLHDGYSPEEARAVLPNSLKTEVVMTANYREWRHILKLRTAKDAHPQMRELMIPLLHDFQKMIPVIFDDIVA